MCVDACVALVSVDVVEFVSQSDTGNTGGQVGPTQSAAWKKARVAAASDRGSCKSKLLDVSRDAVHTARHVRCLLCAESMANEVHACSVSGMDTRCHD